MSDNEVTVTGSGRKWRNRLISLVVIVCAVMAAGLLVHKHSQHTASISALPQVSGHQVTLPIRIDTAGQTINAAQIYLHFDPKLVQVQSVSKAGSLFSLWVTGEPAFSNTTGQISFAGGVIKPGFKGAGQVGSVVLTAQHAVMTQLNFSSDTTALLADGLGTPITLTLAPITVKVP